MRRGQKKKIRKAGGRKLRNKKKTAPQSVSEVSKKVKKVESLEKKVKKQLAKETNIIKSNEVKELKKLEAKIVRYKKKIDTIGLGAKAGENYIKAMNRKKQLKGKATSTLKLQPKPLTQNETDLLRGAKKSIRNYEKDPSKLTANQIKNWEKKVELESELEKKAYKYLQIKKAQRLLKPKVKIVYQQQNAKFNVSKTKGTINFEGGELPTLKEIQNTADSLVGKLTKGLKNGDKYKIYMVNENTGKTFGSTWITKGSDFEEEMGIDFMESVETTNEGNETGSQFDIYIDTAGSPNGGRGKQVLRNDLIYTKQSILKINNDDELCLGRAIVIQKAMWENHPKVAQIKKGRKIQDELTHQLYSQCGVEEKTADLDIVKQFEEALDISITIIDLQANLSMIYPNTDSEEYIPKDKNVYVLKNMNHYDLISEAKIQAFFSTNKYCSKCKTPYNGSHKCKSTCNICWGDCDSEECFGDKKVRKPDWRNCDSCNRNFPTSKCFIGHKETACAKWWKCSDCNKCFSERVYPRMKHICNEYKCCSCNKVVEPNHKCYMLPKPIKEPTTKYIYFDYEAEQSEGIHNVMYGIAMYNDSDEVFEFEDNDSFCEWLFTEEHKGYSVIAHNGRGYDFQFILRWIYTKSAYKPFVIYAGSKVMTFSVGQGMDIRFVDSLNFLTMRLADFPKTFGITEMKKGYFPHFFNIPENYDYVGEIPDKHFFGANAMTSTGKATFSKWWKARKDEKYIWDERKEMKEYCISDTAILKEGCKIFRKTYLDISGIDPFKYTTIASVCMAIFRANHIIDDFQDRYYEAKEIAQELEKEDRKLYMEDFNEEIYQQVFKEKKIAIFDYEEQKFMRKSFFGGRTNAIKLLHTFKGTEVGKYADITSLYPSVNYYDEYPVGHPEKLTEGFDLTLDSYKLAIVDCYVIPPNDLYFPVLPTKGEKLMFDLLAKRGVWTSVELKLALEKGYKIKEIYEVWNWELTTTDLFRPYVAKFLKIKQESSGFPDWVKCELDKEKYIKNYLEGQGIQLDRKKIKKNKGMRAVAKLCLNSLWGKFGQRLNMAKTEMTDKPARFSEIMFNEKYCNQSFNVIDENRIEVNYKMKDDYVENSATTNIAIATFTTSHARKRLYWGLNKLDRQVLYHDTDSLVYKYDCMNPAHKSIELGDYLGDWTDELEGVNMVGTFCGAGPKNYSYETDDGEFHTKIKGFTLNWDAVQKLNHDSMIDLIKRREEDIDKEDYQVEYNMITRNKTNKIIESVKMKKQYNFCYDKRVIEEDGDSVDTYPVGFIKNKKLYLNVGK